MKLSIFALSVLLFGLPLQKAQAQRVEISDNPETVEVSGSQKNDDYAPRNDRSAKPATGKKAAQKYFQKGSQETKDANEAVASEDHYLMIGVGGFISSDAYRWGNPDAKDPGELNLDVTYRIGEWVNSMDFLFRIDYQTFDVRAEKAPRKLSFLPMITFPDAGSKFPVYFGVGAGLGVFFSQLDSKSSLSLDYQLLLGVRFFNVVNRMGFYAETGLKNHLLLLSSGQFNGIFLNVGTVHTF